MKDIKEKTMFFMFAANDGCLDILKWSLSHFPVIDEYAVNTAFSVETFKGYLDVSKHILSNYNDKIYRSKIEVFF